MKLKFMGIKTAKSTGCGICGRRSSRPNKSMTHRFSLPSGRVLPVKVGGVYDVSSEDAEFLLNYKGVFRVV